MKLYVGRRGVKQDGCFSAGVEPADAPDCVVDVMDMPGVADDSCDEVLASHVLEHLEWPDSFKALAGFARALKPGGVLKVGVPDVRLLLDRLASGESDFRVVGLLYGVGGRGRAFDPYRYAFTEGMLRRLLTILGFGSFSSWTPTLSESANGRCPPDGGAKAAVSVHVAARKIGPAMADPVRIYEALTRRAMDDPTAVMADMLSQEPNLACGPLDAAVYQRIHFQLIDARQRIKYLETAIRKMEAESARSQTTGTAGSESGILRIHRTHRVSKAAAIRKIDGFLDAWLRRPLPAGVQVEDAGKSWTEDRMTFSYKFSRGVLSATIQGTIEVSDGGALLECRLPRLVTAFVEEDKIRRFINDQFDALFV
jgi:hypothetical protein